MQVNAVTGSLFTSEVLQAVSERSAAQQLGESGDLAQTEGEQVSGLLWFIQSFC